MFDGRIYRAAFVPLLFVLVIAGFSLMGRPASLSSTLAPDAFNGARAYADLQAMTRRFPDRAPGGVGDGELAGYIAQQLRGLGGPTNSSSTQSGGPTPGGSPGGGFQVSTRRLRAQTIDGVRRVTAGIALGHIAGTPARKPFVLPFSQHSSSAPESLQLTLDAAISQELGVNPG